MRIRRGEHWEYTGVVRKSLANSPTYFLVSCVIYFKQFSKKK